MNNSGREYGQKRMLKKSFDEESLEKRLWAERLDLGKLQDGETDCEKKKERGQDGKEDCPVMLSRTSIR